MNNSADKKCRIALISVYDTENNAVRLMSAILRKLGFHVAEIYFKDWKNNAFTPHTPEEMENLLAVLKKEKITLAAISLRASAYVKTATAMTNMIRKNAGIPVLWGGAHVILCPEECIRIADMICIGEGDAVLPELAERLSRGYSIDDVENLWIRNEDKIIRNPLSNLVENLNTLPFRDYTGSHKYVIDGRMVTLKDPMVDEPVFQIITTRGCPYQCSYCYNSTYKEIFKGKGRYYRGRSVDNVIAELENAGQVFKNLKRIKFDDEVFPFQKEWLDEFVRKYKKKIGLPFEAFTEPNLVNRECFEKLKDAGLEIVYMGIQSNERITKELYDRNAPDEKVKEAAEILHELDFDVRYQVILDDPLSTTEDHERLFNLLMSFPRPFELYLFSLMVYPNTGLAKKLLKDGLITEDQVEGKNDKTFRQLRVDLSYPRKPEDTYWAALLVLMTKSFIPRGLLRAFYNARWLAKFPLPLVMLAQFSNLLKMGWVATGMLAKGELSWHTAKRWMNLKSFITQ